MAFILEDESQPFVGKVQYRGMDPQFMGAFQAMAQYYYDRTGQPLKVNDAFRTYAQQAEAKRRKPNLAAAPGHSQHEQGRAMDLNTGQANALARSGLLQHYGFTRPMSYEPWHIQMANTERRMGKTAATTGQGGGFILEDEESDTAAPKPRGGFILEDEGGGKGEDATTPPQGLGKPGWDKKAWQEVLEEQKNLRAPLPIEAFYPEMMAGEFSRGKGLSGEEISSPQSHLPWQVTAAAIKVPERIKEAAVSQMEKVPALKARMEVPVEAAYPEAMAGDFSRGKGLSGESVTMPSVARTTGEALEWGIWSGITKVPGLFSKAAGWLGRGPKPSTIDEIKAADAVAKAAAARERKAGKLQESLTRQLQEYGGEVPGGAVPPWKETKPKGKGKVSALEDKPWQKAVQVESDKVAAQAEKEIVSGAPPETPMEVATVENLGVSEIGETIQNSPKNRNFKQLAQEILPGARARGIEPPTPPIGAGTKLEPVAPALKKDFLPAIDTELRSSNLVAADKWGMTNNPVVDYFGGMLNYLNRRLQGEGWLNDVVKFVPGLWKDIRQSTRAGQKLLGPIFERFVALNTPREERAARIAALGRQVRDPESAAGKAIVSEMEALTKQNKDYLKDIGPQLRQIYKERQLVLDYLASKYANVRIKLTAGGDNRYLHLMSDGEKEAARVTRKYYDLKKGELQGQGLWTKEEDYVNFVFGNPLTATGKGFSDTGATAFAKGLWYGKKKITPSMLDFMHRTPGAKDWFPFWYQSLKMYIPSVERKLSFNPYLRKWVPEAETWKFQYPRAYSWFNDFQQKNFGGEEVKTLNRMVNGLIGTEYARTLAGNLAVPVLHAFKLLQTYMAHGLTPLIKGAYRYGKGITQMLTRNPGLERQILEFYVPMQRLTRAIEQQPGMAKALSPGFWKRASMFATPIIEHIDNGINLFANMSRGLKAGADPHKIHMMNLDTLMRLNFTGFSMPPAFSGTGGRTAFMYMGQPWKIMENKIDFVVKGLRGERDDFGGAYFWKMLRMAAIMGVGIQAGKSVGVDLWKHFGHLPGEAMTETGEETVSLFTPPMQLAYDIKTKGVPKGLYQHFTQVPGLDRAMRLAQGQTTRGYETPWHQMFGLKEADWKERAKERLRKSQKSREARERKRRTPTQVWLDEIIGR